MFEERERKLGWRGEARGQLPDRPIRCGSGMPAMPTHHLTHPRSVLGTGDMGEQLPPLPPPRCFHFPSRCPGSAGFSHMARVMPSGESARPDARTLARAHAADSRGRGHPRGWRWARQS